MRRWKDSILGLFSNDIGIDLGTANTLVWVKDRGIVINEPSIVAVNQKTGQIVAVGQQAKDMLGRTPAHIVAVQPVVDGVISDYEVTSEMLSYLINKAQAGPYQIARASRRGRRSFGHHFGRGPRSTRCNTCRWRSGGPHHRRAHGCCDRHRTADTRTFGQHDHRHRRWNDGRRYRVTRRPGQCAQYPHRGRSLQSGYLRAHQERIQASDR